MKSFSAIAFLLILIACLIVPASAYTWKPISMPNVGSNVYLTFNGSSSLVVPGSITITFNGVNSSGLYVGSLSGSCNGKLFEKNNASHLIVADINIDYSVNKTNVYYSSGSTTYTLSNIQAYNLSMVNNPTHNELQINLVPSSCDIGVQNGFGIGVSTSWGPYKALSGQLYAGEAGYALPNIIDDAFANGSSSAGYIRTTVHTIDALTGSQISGTTINLRDVENNSWVNSTADADGELIIDVLESHTLDIYGSYPGVFTESQELGAVPGGDYYLPMYTALPTPADGYVNVLTYVTSAVDDGPISNAKVVYTYIDGSLKGQQVNTFTDNWGASLAVLKNATVVVIDVSKPNYNGQSASHTLPNFADVMYTFRLSKGGMITAVPTVTDPATGAVITAVPTYLPYCDPSRGDYDEALCGHSKDNALFGQLRDSGSVIIGLCILAIIFGLLKMIMKF